MYSHATLQQAQRRTWSSDTARNLIRINDVKGRAAVDGGSVPVETEVAAEGGLA